MSVKLRDLKKYAIILELKVIFIKICEVCIKNANLKVCNLPL